MNKRLRLFEIERPIYNGEDKYLKTKRRTGSKKLTKKEIKALIRLTK
jgi:hypothetical protein